LAQLRFVHGHLPLLVADLVQADQIITILRDPVDRVISHLRHTHRYKMPDRPLEEVYESPWFHALFFVDYQVKQFAFHPDDAPECHMDVLAIDEARFARAVENLDRIDVLGFTDRYDELTSELVRRYGWTLPPTERREVAPVRTEVSRALRARIEADNEADVAFYHEARQRRAAR
jgi:hypothetical protein